MSYYDDREKYEKKGIDYDLSACLEYNPQDEFTLEDIEKVLAVYDGVNDESDWHWILFLKNNKFVYLRGGCDYTGWDCQSWASSRIFDNPEDALNCAITGDVPVYEDKSPVFGLGRMISMLSGTFNNNINEVYLSLKEQVYSEKNKTWRENHPFFKNYPPVEGF